MSYQQVYTCDICGAIRGPSNHWLTARLTYDGDFIISQWDELNAAKLPNISHLCGETCAATHLTRFIAKSREEAQ